MKENRLFRMLYLLLEKGQCSALFLADSLEVSTRTIYRDMDTLSSAGIPIYATTGRNGGIQVNQHYVLNQSYLTDPEKQDILQALQTMMTLQNKKENATLSKLSSLFDISVSQWLEINFSKWDSEDESIHSFDLLKHSILNHTLITFSYVNSNSVLSKRKVKPVKLIFKSTTWYLQAYCFKQQEFRIFKLSRMINLESTKEVFQPMTIPDTTFNLVQEKIECRCLFSSTLAYRVYDEFDYHSIHPQEDGTLLVETRLPNEKWLPLYFLSFGSHLQVLSPPSIQKAIQEEVNNIIKNTNKV